MADRDLEAYSRVGDEVISDRLIHAHRVTFGDLLAEVEVPPGLHWALLPEMAQEGDLGRDGHPRHGLVLPDTGLPRRMWAGGEISFTAPFARGELVTRETAILDVTRKTGRSGDLAFVRVQHTFTVNGSARTVDLQNIVYREDPSGEPPVQEVAETWPDAIARTATPGPVTLFRYSAITFNGHRIHYDAPYARDVEGYDGLVVHGPMQALWMLNLATSIMGAQPPHFTYRGLAPLIVGQKATIEARKAGEGLALRVRNADGVKTMEARALDVA